MKLTNLRGWRYVRGMSQEELARRAGMTRSGISRLEIGAGCTPRTAMRLALALDLRVEDLLENPPVRASERVPIPA
jgi:transcriptional regulator with XRE-family HTH domain